MVQAKEAIPGMTPGAIVPQSEEVEPGFTPKPAPPVGPGGTSAPINPAVVAKPTLHGTEDDRSGLSSWAPELNRLYDTTTGKAVRLDYKDMHQSLLEGKVGFRKGDSIPMIGTDGASYSMPAENVNAAIQAGYRLEHPNEIAVREFRGENKGISGSAKAFLTNFADEALFGVPGVIYQHSSDVTDLERAKLQALKHDNAIANAAGGIAGFGASMLYGGELFQFASKGGRVAEKLVLSGAEKLLAKEGEELAAKALVNKMVEAGVEKAAAERYAPGLITKTAANMAKLGVEGVIVNAPKEITEAVYDPTAAAEHTMVALGAGAGLGFITGPLGGKFLRLSKDLAKVGAERLDVSEALKAENLALSAAGVDKAAAKKIGIDNLDESAKILLNEKVIDGPMNFKKLVERTENFKTTAGEEIGDIIKYVDTKARADGNLAIDSFNLTSTIEKLQAFKAKHFMSPDGKTIDPILRAEAKEVDRIINSLDQRLPEPFRKGAVAAREAAEKAGKFKTKIEGTDADLLKQLEDIVPKGGKTTFVPDDGSKVINTITMEEAQALKKRLGDYANWDATAKSSVNAVRKQAYNIVRNEIDESIGRIAEQVDPSIMERYLRAKNNYAAASDISYLINNKEAQLMGNRFIGLTDSIWGGAGSVAGIAHAIASGNFIYGLLYPIATTGMKKIIESTYTKTWAASKLFAARGGDKAGLLFAEQAIKWGADQLDRITPDFISRITRPGLTPSTVGLSAIGRFIGNPDVKPKTSAEKQKLVQDVQAKLNEFMLNQQQTADRVAKLTTPIGAFGAPKISQAYMQQMLKTYQYLQSILPNANKELNPFKKNVSQLSDKQLADFERALRVVDNPYAVLDSLQNGTLTQGEVDVLSNLYPNIYSGLQKKITEVAYAMKDKSGIPFDQRMKYSLLLGVPLDPSLSNTAAYQGTFAKPTQKAPAGKSLELIGPKSNPYATPITKALGR